MVWTGPGLISSPYTPPKSPLLAAASRPRSVASDSPTLGNADLRIGGRIPGERVEHHAFNRRSSLNRKPALRARARQARRQHCRRDASEHCQEQYMQHDLSRQRISRVDSTPIRVRSSPQKFLLQSPSCE